MLQFLRERAPRAEVTMSVCTGSALLARAGLLDGVPATSNKMFFSLASKQSDAVEWREAARWVDAGRFVTSSGVSAGTDMALAVIERLFGAETAESVCRFTEYQWHRDADDDPFKAYLNQADAAQSG
jgi:transcriptional regulator GlxA family with amidase domain